jgi:hypothetical protein
MGSKRYDGKRPGGSGRPGSRGGGGNSRGPRLGTGGGGGGHGRGTNHRGDGTSSSSVAGPVGALVFGIALLAVLLVGTPVAVVVHALVMR